MKKTLIATLLFILTMSTSAFAHTHISSSTPENGQTITDELQEITLTFEGKIEQGSTFSISNTEGQTIDVENISIDGEKMIGTFANPLENGEYLVNWDIIGADGHPINGEFSFTVNVAESETPTATTNETTDQSTQQETTVKTEGQSSTEPAVETESNQSQSYLIPVIIILLLVVIVGVFFGLRRKK